MPSPKVPCPSCGLPKVAKSRLCGRCVQRPGPSPEVRRLANRRAREALSGKSNPTHSERMKDWWKLHPEARIRRANQIRRQWNCQSFREAHREGHKDPIYRGRISTRMKEFYRTHPEMRLEITAGAHRYLRNPASKARMRRNGVRNYLAQNYQNTSLESDVAKIILSEGIEFNRQFNLHDHFLCDFYLPSLNLIVEADGCFWHGCEECGFWSRRNDAGRNAYIRAHGYDLLVLKEHEGPEFQPLKQILEVQRNA